MLGAALVALYCVVAAVVAVVVYLFLYHNFVPLIAFNKPLYFDFVYHHTLHSSSSSSCSSCSSCSRCPVQEGEAHGDGGLHRPLVD